MSGGTCMCSKSQSPESLHQSGLPLICLVPRDSKDFSRHLGKEHHHHQEHDTHQGKHSSHHHKKQKGFKLLSDEYIKKNFKLPPRPLYLDPFRRPLITFPMSNEEISANFTIDKKAKINQAILDGILDSSAQISQPSVFPYSENSYQKRKEKKAKDDTEMIYILQLPDLEHRCPIHNEIVKTPRFIWHSVKKSHKDKKGGERAHGGESGGIPGGGPLNKPKPWLLSRHTDFDYYSQW